MANEEHLAKLKDGIVAWNNWRNANQKVRPDLSGANLSDFNLWVIDLSGTDLKSAILNGANLKRANLDGADLTGAYLCEANLISVDLKNANLRNTRLNGADLSDADAINADLSGARLIRANLDNTNLQGANLGKADLSGAFIVRANMVDADLSGARLYETTFGAIDLSKTIGLNECNHRGPSIADHRTLASSGKLPREFLQGVGLQDWQIEAAKLYNPKLSPTEITDIVYEVDRIRSENPIQIHNLFISYTHKDALFIDHLEGYLRARKILFWRDVHDAPAGPLEEIVIRAMDNRTVLLILSEHSVESDWVEFEAQKAREIEKELKRQGKERHVLCPIALDESWLSCSWSGPLRNQIKKYNVLNFSDWTNSSLFQSKFKRLVEGLDLFYKEG